MAEYLRLRVSVDHTKVSSECAMCENPFTPQHALYCYKFNPTLARRLHDFIVRVCADIMTRAGCLRVKAEPHTAGGKTRHRPDAIAEAPDGTGIILEVSIVNPAAKLERSQRKTETTVLAAARQRERSKKAKYENYNPGAKQILFPGSSPDEPTRVIIVVLETMGAFGIGAQEFCRTMAKYSMTANEPEFASENGAYLRFASTLATELQKANASRLWSTRRYLNLRRNMNGDAPQGRGTGRSSAKDTSRGRDDLVGQLLVARSESESDRSSDDDDEDDDDYDDDFTDMSSSPSESSDSDFPASGDESLLRSSESPIEDESDEESADQDQDQVCRDHDPDQVQVQDQDYRALTRAALKELGKDPFNLTIT